MIESSFAWICAEHLLWGFIPSPMLLMLFEHMHFFSWEGEEGEGDERNFRGLSHHWKSCYEHFHWSPGIVLHLICGGHRWCQYHLPKQLKKTVLGKRTSGDGIRVKEDQIPSWMWWTVSLSTTELFDNLRPDEEGITWFNTDVSHCVVAWLATRSCRSELEVSGGRYCDPSLVEEERLVNTWPDGLDSEGSEGEAAQLQSIVDYSWPDAGVDLEIDYKVSLIAVHDIIVVTFMFYFWRKKLF